MLLEMKSAFLLFFILIARLTLRCAHLIVQWLPSWHKTLPQYMEDMNQNGFIINNKLVQELVASLKKSIINGITYFIPPFPIAHCLSSSKNLCFLEYSNICYTFIFLHYLFYPPEGAIRPPV